MADGDGISTDTDLVRHFKSKLKNILKHHQSNKIELSLNKDKSSDEEAKMLKDKISQLKEENSKLMSKVVDAEFFKDKLRNFLKN